VRPVNSQKEDTMTIESYAGKLAFTVTWQAKPGEATALAAIVNEFLPKARQEPGAAMVTVQQMADDPSQFLFYEVFDNDAAFAAHQETDHFKSLILEQALPRLAKRERTKYTPF
jgi:quinol monooxygenase YgiN